MITGASHTGKTLLAQRLLERYHWPYLSIDLLKMGLIRSGNTALTPQDDPELADYLWPIVREMVKTAIENRQHLVVEGGYIPLHWREGLDDRYLKEIRCYCLVMSRKYLLDHFPDVKKYACAIEQRLDDSDCTLESLLAENAFYAGWYEQAGFQPILIDRDYRIALF